MGLEELKEEEIKKVVDKVMEERRLTCPYAREILTLGSKIGVIEDGQEKNYKMVWGVILLLLGTSMAALLNLIITISRNGGLSAVLKLFGVGSVL